MSNESAVRDAANTLYDAIVAAKGEGLNVAWPQRASDLPAIVISATAKAGQGGAAVLPTGGVIPEKDETIILSDESASSETRSRRSKA